MENLLQNIASGLWIVLGVYCFFVLRMWNKRKSDYCPNCGAKMDGAE